MGSIIKSVIPFFNQGGMEVQFYGDHEPEVLKQCLCCDGYHPVYIGVCPKTGKLIEAEARRQAEEECIRGRISLETKAKTAKEKYLLDHGVYGKNANWKNCWRYWTAVIGAVAIYFIFAFGIFSFTSGIFHQAGPLIAIIVSVIWFAIWARLEDNRHKKLAREQAHDIYRRIMWGKEEAEAG